MRFVTIICIMIILFSINSTAEDITQSLIDKQFEASGGINLEAGSEGAKAFDSNFSFKNAVTTLAKGEFPMTPKGILERVLDILAQEIRLSALGAAQIIFVAILLGLLSHFSLTEKGVFDTAFYICYAVIIGITIKVFIDASQIGKNVISDMVLFMKGAVPVMAVFSMSTGNMARAAISTLAIQGIQVTAWIVDTVFVPLIYISASISATGNLSKDFNLKGFVVLTKKLATWGIGFVLLIFSGIMTAQGMVANAMDNVTGKAVKYTISNLIPFVGGVLSDSLDTIVACGAVLKNAVGIAGIIAVAAICLAPVIKISAIIIVLRVTGAVAGMVSDARLTDVIEDFASLLEVLVAMVLGVCLMFIVALAIMATGVGVMPSLH